MFNFRHLFVTRPRLVLAMGLGTLAYWLLPSGISGLTRGLCSWNIAAWAYLIVQWWLMLRADPARIRQVADLQDESAGTMLTLVSFAAAMSLLAILLELGSARHMAGNAQVFGFALTAITLIGAWILLPTAFAIHYAHLFYGSHGKHHPLRFPDQTSEPVYWDFLYFSFTIAVAAQTADIAVGTMRARRLVLAQSVLAFVFNLVFLGLSINVVGGLLS
ncbi:hypothetical protein IGB42_04187 [Andreprevotia sp. IGB-42]|uniref:DUF1345 domain-containing protein n=1 Tax=Andreprevotia sp. IGB-42 TaxID=2497473 RepID=UPI0013596A71|nr:DUF1345 domain-containing protein [Andreprevotia sp. IGB-42]KAF0811350.1 hypothetical protein IGB42_04187 [Andreprevotia sp. IGB-42]